MKKFLTSSLRFSNVLIFGGSCASLASVAAFFSESWWGFDLTCHFRAQYMVGLLSVSFLLLLFRKFKAALVFAVFGLVNLGTLLPFWMREQAPVSSTDQTLRLLLINVRTENTRSDRVLSSIQQQNPDLILLEETDKRWLSELKDLEKDYPYAVAAPRSDNFGIALYSRLPLENHSVIYLGEEGVPSITADIKFAGTNIAFLGTHPVPPRGPLGHWYRNDQLKAVGTFLSEKKSPVILLGDLNITPWSAHFQRLEKKANLYNTAIGWGVQASWPAYLVPLRIPLDHCLVSPSLKTVRREIGANVGSDHFPVLIELAFDTAAIPPGSK